MKLNADKIGGFRGIHIFPEDVLLLKQLLIHQSIRSTSIHEFFGSVEGVERNKDGVTNRLNKLSKAGIVKMKTERIRGGNYFVYHYRMGIRGISVLVANGDITENDCKRAYETIRKIGIPSFHAIATSIVANRIFVECMDRGLMEKVSHSKGTAHELFGSPLSKGQHDSKGVIPDWVFYDDETVVCIEVDTGTQNGGIMTGKYKRYINYGKVLNEIGKKLIVIFSVVDQTVDNKVSDNRDKRVTSIKNYAPPFSEWSDSEELGIHFYSLSANRTPSLVGRIFTAAEPSEVSERNQYAVDWSEMATKVLRGKNSITPIDNDAIFNPRRNRRVDCGLLIAIEDVETYGKRKRLLAVLYGEEGSIETHQLISANVKRISAVNDTREHAELSLLVCYIESTNAEEDVFGSMPPCRISHTDFVSWITASTTSAVAPDVLCIASPFKKEWRRFNE